MVVATEELIRFQWITQESMSLAGVVTSETDAHL
jgi:hypothetical protein